MSASSPRRPFALRVLPLWVRQRVYYRFFARRAERYGGLFDDASLAFAPSVSLRLAPGDVAHCAIALTGVYEHDVSRRLARLARLGGLLVDVGANYGYYPCLWLGMHSGNRAIAFEALPANADALRSNIDRNGFSARADVQPLAVGRRAGHLAFRTGASDQTGQGGLAGANETANVSVAVCTLDDFFSARPNESIDVLKIDTEGADTWVLEGARGLLERGRIRHIFFEQFPDRMRALGIREGAASELLESFGYRVRPLDGDEWYAVHPSAAS